MYVVVLYIRSVSQDLGMGHYEKLHFHIVRRPLRGISALAPLRTGAAPLRTCLSLRSPD